MLTFRRRRDTGTEQKHGYTRLNGRDVTGGVVYGYRNVPVLAGVDSSGNPRRSHVLREIEPEKARIVEAIFRAAADRVGLRTIARALNGDPSATDVSGKYFGDTPVPSPRKETASWDPSTVKAILDRELYRGTIVWGKYRNVDRGGRTRCRSRQTEANWIRVDRPELRIVSEELWAAAHEPRRARDAGRVATAVPPSAPTRSWSR